MSESNQVLLLTKPKYFCCLNLSKYFCCINSSPFTHSYSICPVTPLHLLGFGVSVRGSNLRSSGWGTTLVSHWPRATHLFLFSPVTALCVQMFLLLQSVHCFLSTRVSDWLQLPDNLSDRSICLPLISVRERKPLGLCEVIINTPGS